MDLIPISRGLLINITLLAFLCGVMVGMIIDFQLRKHLDKLS